MPTVVGARAGSLVISSNDPVAPQTTIALMGIGLSAYTVPVLTSLSKPTQATSSSSVDITLSGSDFFPQSVVRVGGQPVTTSFLNGSLLKATIPPALLSTIGELSLTVYNPTPVGGESSSAADSVSVIHTHTVVFGVCTIDRDALCCYSELNRWQPKYGCSHRRCIRQNRNTNPGRPQSCDAGCDE